MGKIQTFLKNAALYTLSLMLIATVPTSVFADEPETYTYDAHNGRWNSNKWVYDPATNVYVPAPSGEKPPAPAATDTETTDSTPKVTTNTGGNATAGQTVGADTKVDINTTTDVSNDIESDAQTGDAGVTSNTKAGDAGSGNADVNTTIVNSIHSTVDGETNGIAHFTTNIYGDVVGDITIGPSIQNAEANQDIDINNDTNIDNSGTITNDVKLTAGSGDAKVSDNTKAGSATSGNANVVANVLNFINTIISANKSFVGTINIYGNLNGDILVSPEFIPQLLASNAVEATEIDLDYGLNLNNEQSIVNNVDLKATTGNATVEGNTKAGQAKTGNAQTKLTVLNLTGRKVDAKNSLLVFVNVLGKWIGMIVDAPNATAAAFGSGVTTNTNVNVSSQTNASNKSKIINNLDLSAESGDASVTNNTEAGDAETGNATASANIANVDTTIFKVSDWFGILFINVFGTWIGSFGIDTSAGTVARLASPNKTKQVRHMQAPNIQFGFIPHNGSYTSAGLGGMTIEASPENNQAEDKESDEATGAIGSTTGSASGQNPLLSWLVLSGLIVAGAFGTLPFMRNRINLKAPAA